MRKLLLFGVSLTISLAGLILAVFQPYSWQCPDSRSVLNLVFNQATSRILVEYASYGDYVEVWSSNGESLIASSQEIRGGHTGSSASLSPDGRQYLVGMFDKTAYLWEISTNKLLQSFRGHTGYVNYTAFSPDGKTVLTGSDDHTAKLWDVQTGLLLHTLQGHTDVIDNISFSPNGKIALTSSKDGSTKLWDVQTGLLLYTLQSYVETKNYRSIVASFSPGGNVVATGNDDSTIELWDVQTGNLSGVLRDNAGGIAEVTFSHDGTRLMTSSYNGAIRLWDIKTRTKLLSIHQDIGIPSEALSLDGRVVASSEGDGIKLWDANTGNLLRALTTYSSREGPLAFSPDGTMLMSSDENIPILWDTQTGKLIRPLCPTILGKGWQYIGIALCLLPLIWILYSFVAIRRHIAALQR